MRITSQQQAETLRDLIGQQNIEACGRALDDGAEVWIFTSEEEIKEDPDLTPKERQQCLTILKTEGLGYAGWIRPPIREIPPALRGSMVPAHGYDTHGNCRTNRALSSAGPRH